MASAQETGLFSASLRVTEAVVPVPSLIASTAFPILVRGVGQIGVVVVSGLPQVEDHRLVVATLRARLGG